MTAPDGTAHHARHTRCQAAIVREGHLLLVRCVLPDGHAFWVLPGGGREPGETDVQAVAREVREEVRVVVAVGAVLDDVAADPPDGTYARWRTFRCTIVAGEPAPGGGEGSAVLTHVRWLPLDLPDTWEPALRADRFLHPQLKRLRAALLVATPTVPQPQVPDQATLDRPMPEPSQPPSAGPAAADPGAVPTGGAEPRYLVLERAAFDRIRDDPRLHRVLTLARIVNTIRFAEVAMLTSGPEGTPSATRQGACATFYLAALLWEALDFVDRAGEQLRGSAAFRDHMVPLLRDASVRALRRGVLSRLRNQAVYHHDDGVIPAGLRIIADGEFVMLQSGADCPPWEAYYDLADVAVMQFALGSPDDPEQFAPRGTAALGAILRAGRRFADAADHLIREYALATGWAARTQPPG